MKSLVKKLYSYAPATTIAVGLWIAGKVLQCGSRYFVVSTLAVVVCIICDIIRRMKSKFSKVEEEDEEE